MKKTSELFTEYYERIQAVGSSVQDVMKLAGMPNSYVSFYNAMNHGRNVRYETVRKIDAAVSELENAKAK